MYGWHFVSASVASFHFVVLVIFLLRGGSCCCPHSAIQSIQQNFLNLFIRQTFSVDSVTFFGFTLNSSIVDLFPVFFFTRAGI
jgi:hypothetical protein